MIQVKDFTALAVGLLNRNQQYNGTVLRTLGQRVSSC